MTTIDEDKLRPLIRLAVDQIGEGWVHEDVFDWLYGNNIVDLAHEQDVMELVWKMDEEGIDG